MRIIDVNIPESEIHNGLKEVKMKNLQQLVLLTGKNGSGKTRLLELLSKFLTDKPTQKQVEEIEQEFKKSGGKSKTTKEDPIKEKVKFNDNQYNQKDYEKLKEEEGEKQEKQEKLYQEYEKIKKWNRIITDKLADEYPFLSFLPKKTDLTECENIMNGDMYKYARKMENLDIENWVEGVFPKMQELFTEWLHAGNENRGEFLKLQELLRDFLEVKIEKFRPHRGQPIPTLFTFPLSNNKLSEGQRILLQFCLAFLCHEKTLDKMIIYMDEPENHLHPSVVIKIINYILKKNLNSQIWIATHSVPILAAFDPTCIWYMEKGDIMWAGNEPEKVLSSLLGSEEYVNKLHDFIGFPAMLGYLRHAHECLYMPISVSTGQKDPQTLQIRKEINVLLKKGEEDSCLRILDYGAGKGRLLSSIINANQEPLNEFIKKFDYIAFDKFQEDKKACLRVIREVYKKDAQKRYFNSYDKLLSCHDKGTFDVIILCNVLHEIDPLGWLDLFSEEGYIYQALSDKGVLLLAEDNEMPVGEKAYSKGFIVLDTVEIKDLFCITGRDKDFKAIDIRRDGRLKMHIVPKKCIGRVTAESREKALKGLQRKAQEKIKEIREMEGSYKNGKKHGFWVQQYANTGLALKELS